MHIVKTDAMAITILFVMVDGNIISNAKTIVVVIVVTIIIGITT